MLVLSASSGKNLELAQAFVAEGAGQGLTIEHIHLPDLDLPLYGTRYGAHGPGPGLERLEQALRNHGSLIICAPEYNGSIPPLLTNAIAWLSVTTPDFRALFNQRPVALATHSGGGQKVLLAMRQQLAHLGCLVLGRELLSNSEKPANPDTIAALVNQLQQLET
ncbi:MAG: NAD(P)H-dependent oxidoreductase [Cyanobacteriota bacterium]|nr:NAD(P)H-dependent oxidoreductase [Cyanobacteriota bacterium]